MNAVRPPGCLWRQPFRPRSRPSSPLPRVTFGRGVGMWTSPPGQVISPPRRRAPSIDALTWRGRAASSTGATQPPRWSRRDAYFRAGGYSIVHTHTPIAFVRRSTPPSPAFPGGRARPSSTRLTASTSHLAGRRSPIPRSPLPSGWLGGETDRACRHQRAGPGRRTAAPPRAATNTSSTCPESVSTWTGTSPRQRSSEGLRRPAGPSACPRKRRCSASWPS